MGLLSFRDYALWTNIAVFAVAALAVGGAGTKVAGYADTIAVRTGIGHAAVGFVMLGAVTSLPEVAVSIFAALGGTPGLAVDNLLGEIAMQRAMLAGVDGFLGREALTVIAASPSLLLQATLCTFILIVVGIAVVVGDVAVFGIGLWSWGLLALYVFSVWQIFDARRRRPWVPRDPDMDGAPMPEGAISRGEMYGTGLRPFVLKTMAAATVILVGGFLLSRTAEAIAVQTGLGLSFVGAVLLALATSLPELSTVIASVRLRRYEMAISDIIGTNLFSVALIFLVDAIYRGEPVLDLAGKFSLLAALLGALLTAIYLVGLVERRNRTVGRMGVDSLATLVVYSAGLFVLYRLR